MSWRLVAAAVVVSVGALAAACATGLNQPDPTIDSPEAGTDSGRSADAGCPQYNIDTDPKHCGSCTKACTDLQVCSSGACKSACDAPTIKCLGDGGGGCADLTSDTKHCGNCSTACTNGDAGGLAPGPNNPDAGIPFDGGYDGGIGWALGTPGCTKSMCAIACPIGLTSCADKICYDTQNFHDHCGNCTTACAQDTEWCSAGRCCPIGQQTCNGMCVDVLGDPANCGGCNIKCPNNLPQCGGGTCSAGVTYSESFTSGGTPSSQCTNWKTFQAALTGTYSSITISGSNDMVGSTCTGAAADQLCKALKNNTTTSVSCNAKTWVTGACGPGLELSSTGSACTCNSGYTSRPCIGNLNWGGVNTATCGAPTQTIIVTCK